jgi:hypothetical protein
MSRIDRKKSLPSVAFLALCLLPIVGMRLYALREPPERDITTYSLIGQGIDEGRSLYADLWDHKPPGIHVTFALAHRLVSDGPTTVCLLGILGATAVLLGVYASGASRRAALWSAAFWAIVSADVLLQADHPNVEVFQSACFIGGFAILTRMRGESGWKGSLLAGALFAAATLYKHVMIFPAVLVLVSHVMYPPGQTTKRIAFFQALAAVGIIVVGWAATFAYFASVGHLHSFTDAVFVYNRYYPGTLINRLVPKLRHLALVLAGAVMMIALARNGERIRSRRRWGLLSAAMIGTGIAVQAPGQGYPHYCQLWLPLLAIAFGWLATSGQLGGEAANRRKRASIIALLMLGLLEASYFRFSPDGWSKVKYASYGNVFVASRTAGIMLDRMLPPGETFYAWGNETGLYFYSHRRPPTGLFYAYPLVAGPVAGKLTRCVLDQLQERPPLMVVKTREEIAIPPSLDAWIAIRYRELTHILGPLSQEGEPVFAFYIRKDRGLDDRLFALPQTRRTVDEHSGQTDSQRRHSRVQ